jgi:RNA polymerase sigma-70 factor (ECF subfamily)
MLMDSGLMDSGLMDSGLMDSAVTTAAPPPFEPDLMLLHRFTETGDASAFAEIVQRYARVVYSASIRVLGDEGRAQDVSQETFFRLMQRPKLVTHSLAGWLHRTATHLALDVRRSERARKHRELTYGLEQQQTKPENKTGRATWAEVSPYVDQALNEIKEPVRGLLIRHFLQGVPQAELAAELDVSPATLSRRIKSGLEELQQQLRKKGVYIGLATLALFCTAETSSAMPAAFVCELGKMNLVAWINHLPATPAAPAPSSPSFPMRPSGNEFALSKCVWASAGMILLLIACAYATSASWAHPFASPQTQISETARVAPTRVVP